MDPAEAIDALLEELYRQKAAGVKRVSVSDESVALLKELVGGATSVATPLAPKSTSPVAVNPVAKPVVRPASPAPKNEGTIIVSSPLPDPPVIKVPSGTKEEQLLWLQKTINACEVTQKHLEGKKPVFGYGSLNAKVFFVGEAPSLEEVEASRPFVGPAGELLNKIISATGLTEKECYFANLMSWRPKPPTVFGKRPPNASELAFNRPYLLAQIEIIKPRVIVAVGAQAFGALTHSTTPIMQVRGQWQKVEDLEILPTLHPNYLFHSPSLSNKRLVWEDFMQLMTKLGMPISDKQKAYFLSA
jgi:uracil-DNA glycosylase family 4